MYHCIMYLLEIFVREIIGFDDIDFNVSNVFIICIANNLPNFCRDPENWPIKDL